MKQSRFNVDKRYKDNSHWVYNTLTTAMVVLDEEQYITYFINENFANDNSGDFSNLCEMGFFIEDEFDELQYLEELRKTVVESNKSIADIMIAPTMDCNARCYYCFEHGCHHEKMSIETADAVVEYIKENWNHELFNVTWFGGEPLLAPDIIDYISEKMRQEGIAYVSRITTNGYELTPEIVKKAVGEWHTNKIQISIDALFEEYDKVKKYDLNQDGRSFKRVLENTKIALDAGLKVRVRINFNPLEQHKATELMDYLQHEFSKYPNFSSYFAPIDADSKTVPSIAGTFDSISEHPFFSLIKFAQKYGYYEGNKRGSEGNFLYDEKGLLVDLKLYPSPTNCYASCPSVFAIDSKGDLYKCHRVLGKGKKYSSGNVKTGIVKNEIYDFFCNTSLVYDECAECKLLPICQGGCKINAYIYNDEHACSPIKAILPELIEMYLVKSDANGETGC